MRSLRRVAVVVVVLLVGLALVSWFGLKAYIGSSYARDLAASKLTAAVGLPVEVEALSVGGASSTLRFRVTEPTSSDQPAAEILSVNAASADVSLSDLLTQNVAPTQLSASGVSLSLRVSRDGKLLTQLPSSTVSPGAELKIPAVKVENAAVRVKQEGRPDFVLTGIALTVAPDGKRVNVAGTADDPHWGPLSLKATIETADKTGTVELTTVGDGIRDLNLLKSVPFVPASTWAHVGGAGMTPVRATLDVKTGGGFDYDVAFTPAGKADIDVPAIDATIKGVSGTIRVHDARVDLIGCKGTLADGPVDVNGTLDFKPEPSVLTFRVVADKMDVRKLPADWKLPKQLGGKLRGRADLTLKVHADDRIETAGGGEAVIDNPLGLDVGGSDITFQLESNGKRYDFHKAPDKPAPEPKASRRGASRHVARPAVKQAPPPPEKQDPPAAKAPADVEPTTLDATLNLRGIDMAELLAKLKVSVPYKIAGLVTAKVTVTVPLGEADTLSSYRLVGNFSSPQLALDGLAVKDLSAAINYVNGVLTLTELKGSMPKAGETAGGFTGTASAAIEPKGDVTANLNLDRLPLGDILKALAGDATDVSGRVTGKASFKGPIEQIRDPATWTATANVTSDEIGVLGRAVRRASIGLAIAEGKATLKDTRATVEGLPVTAGGTAGLAAPYRFDVDVKTTPDEVADLRKLLAELPIPLAVEGKFDLKTKATGTVQPLIYAASGTFAAADLKLGTTEANKVTFNWAADQARVAVTDLAADVFRGTLGGVADVPLDPAKTGTFNVTFKNLDSAAVTRSLAAFPIRLTGQVSGGFNGSLPPAKAGESRQVAGDLDLSAPRLTVQGIPAERLAGKVAFANESAHYQLEGRTLGGTFDLKGRYPFRAGAAADPKPKGERGSFRLRGADLGRAAEALKVKALGPLGGNVDLSFDFDNDLSDGSGTFAVRNPAWDDETLGDDLSGTVRLRDHLLTVNEFTGRYAGGVLRARARMDLQDTRRNFYSVSVDRADARLLFAPVAALKRAVDGEVSLSVKGRVGDRNSGSGTISVDRGTVAGLAVSGLRVPFDWVGAAGGYGTLTVREATSQAGQGRLTGNVTYNWGSSDRLDGRVQFHDVKLQSVIGSSSVFGNGRITGRFDIAGTNIRSENDLTGTLVGTLNQTSVREIPVLQTITPYLNVSGLTAPFQSGDVRGRLGNGLFRLERLALQNASAQFFADGTVTLAGGRLDLGVVANTGQVGAGARGLRLLGLRIPAIGPVPIGLIQDVSAFVSNRTVRLTVTGTSSNPVVRVNTRALLTEEAVRFLVSRYIPSAGAAVGIGSTKN